MWRAMQPDSRTPPSQLISANSVAVLDDMQRRCVTFSWNWWTVWGRACFRLVRRPPRHCIRFRQADEVAANPIRVLIADDHPVVRVGLRNMLQATR